MKLNERYNVNDIFGNIYNLNNVQLDRLVKLLANTEVGFRLNNKLTFAIQEKDLYNIEVQDSV
jgi:hypothetical protein